MISRHIYKKSKGIHTCISCENLLGVSRVVVKDKNGHHTGFRFKSKCAVGRKSRQPWTCMFCQQWVERKDQTLLDYFHLIVEKKKDEDPEEPSKTELSDPIG